MTSDRHQQRQQRLKEQVDARIAAAQQVRGILMVFTGNGKGKPPLRLARLYAPAGMANVPRPFSSLRRMAQRRTQPSGPARVEFQVMATGFTWETQNRQTDTAACLAVWEHARRMLSDDTLDLVILDEITYMISMDYLPLDELVTALQGRPAHQSVILTGRGCHRTLLDMADTVTEMRPVKHAFDAGIKAQQGIDW